MRATMSQIAKIAKVSRGTVDRVLHNRSGVSDEVRKRVSLVAEQLNYKPNIIGKALAGYGNKRTIGVILTPEDNPFIDDVKKGIFQAYEEIRDFGFQLDCIPMKSNDPNELAALINGQLEKNVSAIAIPTFEHEGVRDAIRKANGRNIAIATFISDLPGIERICFIGHDLERGGRVAGELMGKIINGAGKVAILSGPQCMTAHNQRIKGFTDEISENYTGIGIVELVDILDQDAIGYRQAKTILQKHDDLAGIYITGGGVQGICRAIKEMNKGRVVRVVCFDLVPQTKELVKEGIIDFVIGQDQFFEGYKPVMVLAEYLLSKSLPKTDVIHTKVDIRVRWNID